MSMLAATLLMTATVEPKIGDYWQADLKDASFNARAVSANQSELRKINKDFAQSYRMMGNAGFVRCKEPLKLRIDGKEDDTVIQFILNGTKRMVRIPRSGLNVPSDLAKKPGQRQTLLDFGVLTPALFKDLFQAKFIRMDRQTSEPVFDFTYFPNLDDTSRNRIWVDVKKGIATKREWYSQIDGRLMATFLYENPRQVNNVWFPTKVTVKNADNKVAGVMQYENLKINSGLGDDLFKID
jgi:outer membrane lipoprotein-sorting protein